MTRYIDAEIVLKIIDGYAKTVTTDGKVVVDAIRDIVAVIAPTADVVPKSEAGLMLTIDGATGYFPKAFIIEAIKAYQKQSEEEQERYIPLVDENLNRVFALYKKTVAREIFEEVESICCSYSDAHIFINRTRLSELKKKYTEEKESNNGADT